MGELRGAYNILVGRPEGRRPLGRPIVERVNRNFDERRLTGAVFLDVVKVFDTV
jgi:hypothetical protein